ncbi:hypothetical protein HK107_08220 [Parvularcula sp. ZS-1/3]|uniref:Uncharacterized protein n=1 Tax=Parvularcula mediterranea TaxID=2732508 RepID=A0A7Y3RLI4_9PROT|nr:hypothetical protein [Parvularcula mediterranea]NNU16304.1 hypothetical protein [Parvularcula mediterranea]
MTQSRIIISVFGLLAVAMIGFTYFYAKNAYPSGECQNTEVSRLTSPDDRFDAVMFARQCGENATPSAHVSVIEKAAPLDEGFGNAVIVKGAPGEAFGPMVWSGGVLAVKLETNEVLNVETNPIEGVEIRLTND